MEIDEGVSFWVDPMFTTGVFLKGDRGTGHLGWRWVNTGGMTLGIPHKPWEDAGGFKELEGQETEARKQAGSSLSLSTWEASLQHLDLRIWFFSPPPPPKFAVICFSSHLNMT